MLKKLQSVHSAPRPHWVGNGFPVRSLFNYNQHGALVTPFLLLDYAGPAHFEPSPADRRGVGAHPHRGFETVTIVYQGEVEHRDSTGAGGVIGPGDVQWMTAAAGLVHEEFHSPAFAQRGGVLEMVQLWVNLPARDKMVRPGYQGIVRADIPELALADGAGRLRVIAGEFDGRRGPARTHTPIDVWDIRLAAGARVTLPLTPGHTGVLVVLGGTVQVNGDAVLRDAQWAQFARDGTAIQIEANNDAKLLFLGGEPILEPIAGHGPFVMNTKAEILQAFEDFEAGRFGQMAA